MKRVYCLYRVSTKKQVDKNENDIPMQKNACHDFVIRQNDWSILKEFFLAIRYRHRIEMPYKSLKTRQ